MTPEQIARISLDIGREVTETVQRRLTEVAQWQANALARGETPHHPGWAGEVIPAPGVYSPGQFENKADDK